ncbi:MAG: cold shock domain-containing protein [Bacteroidales bacterium]|nr:cold shock domain-containing protein [Bacteroidales bacterium]
MGRSGESFNKKDVRKKKEKKRKDKMAKKLARKDSDTKSSLDDMIAYVDEFGNITSEPQDPAEKEETNAEDIEVSVPKGEITARSKERTGIVTNFNDSKGFGFIRDDDTRDSIFVHINNTLEDIAVGNKVSFETEKGQKGLAAIKVKVIR